MDRHPLPLAAMTALDRLAAMLPAVCSISAHWDHVTGGWEITAQLDGCDEPDGIDAIRDWATALAGVTELSEPHAGYGHTYRALDAAGSIGGVPVRIWTHIAKSPLPLAVAA